MENGNRTEFSGESPPCAVACEMGKGVGDVIGNFKTEIGNRTEFSGESSPCVVTCE